MIKKFNSVSLILILSIILTFILNVFTAPDKSISLLKVIAQSLGSVALVLFFWNFLIASRFKWFEKLYKPLDKQYLTHRSIAISLVFLIISHLLLNKLGVPSGTPEAATGKYGSISMFVYIFLVVFSIISLKRVHTNRSKGYQQWKHFHKLFILPYFIALYHYFINEEYLALKLAPYQTWMLIINMLGILLALYSTVGYENLRFTRKMKVTSIKKLGPSTLEITMERPLNLKILAGQYGFFKFYHERIGLESHPFTISSTNNDSLTITVKALGDYTDRLIRHLQVNDLTSFDGPYGNFNFRQGHERQIWIAGGIGITPFVSFVKSGIPSEYSVDLIYMHKNDEGIYEELFSIESQNNVNFTYLDYDSTVEGRLDLNTLFKDISYHDHVSIFYCGPDKPREMLEKIIKEYHHITLHYDRFKF